MSNNYDKYYQTDNLFGEPYPELLGFYSNISTKGKLLDFGCGQGRDSIALARLGYEVIGIDNSKVGIAQLNEIAKKEKLPLKGIVGDIYEYSNFDKFDFILLDSMFHFGKKEKEKETELVKKIITNSKPNTQITICIQDNGKKIKILNSILSGFQNLERVHQVDLIYRYEDKESNHHSEVKYKMVTVKPVA